MICFFLSPIHNAQFIHWQILSIIKFLFAYAFILDSKFHEHIIMLL